jgi:hypothetical protein
VIDFLMFAGVGKLLMYLLKKFPPTVDIAKKNKYTLRLLECDLCLGVWIYAALSFLVNYTVYFNGNLFGYFLTGCITSFLVWIFSTGWDDHFRNIVVK